MLEWGMTPSVTHDRSEESLEAKAEWFLEKSVEQRFLEALEDMLFISLMAQVEWQDDHTTFKTVRILESKQS